MKTYSPEPTAVFRGLYAEIENAQGRCQALQVNRNGEGEAGAVALAAHSNVEEQETETESGISGAGEQRRFAQSQAHDSVSVKHF